MPQPERNPDMPDQDWFDLPEDTEGLEQFIDLVQSLPQRSQRICLLSRSSFREDVIAMLKLYSDLMKNPPRTAMDFLMSHELDRFLLALDDAFWQDAVNDFSLCQNTDSIISTGRKYLNKMLGLFYYG